MRSRSRTLAGPAAAVPFALALAGAGCRAPRTQISLRVATDIAPQGPGAALESVLVRVYATPSVDSEGRLAGELRHEVEYPLGVSASRPVLPAELALVPRDGDARALVGVEVEARAAGRALFSTRAIAGYVRGQHTVLEVFLADRCRDERNRCDPRNFTCTQNGCEPIVREALPTRVDFDLAQDAAVALDESSDALDAREVAVDEASLDAPQLDALPTLDASDASDAADGMTGVLPPIDAAITACASFERRCGGGCVDVRSDRAHCGACGFACERDDACAEGLCRPTPRVHTIASDGPDTITAVALGPQHLCAAGSYARGSLHVNGVPLEGFGDVGAARGFLLCFDVAGRVSVARALQSPESLRVDALTVHAEGGVGYVCAAGTFQSGLTVAPGVAPGSLLGVGFSDAWVHCARLDGAAGGGLLRLGTSGSTRVRWLGTAPEGAPNPGSLLALVEHNAALEYVDETGARGGLPVIMGSEGDTALFSLRANLRVRSAGRLAFGAGQHSTRGLVGALDATGAPGFALYGDFTGALSVGFATTASTMRTGARAWWVALLSARGEGQWLRSFGGVDTADELLGVLPSDDGATLVQVGTAAAGTLASAGLTSAGVYDVLARGVRRVSGAAGAAPASWGTRADDRPCGLVRTAQGLAFAASYTELVTPELGGVTLRTLNANTQGVALVRLGADGTPLRSHAQLAQSANFAVECGAVAASPGSTGALLGVSVRPVSPVLNGTLAGAPLTLRASGATDAVLVWHAPTY